MSSELYNTLVNNLNEHVAEHTSCCCFFGSKDRSAKVASRLRRLVESLAPEAPSTSRRSEYSPLLSISSLTINDSADAQLDAQISILLHTTLDILASVQKDTDQLQALSDLLKIQEIGVKAEIGSEFQEQLTTYLTRGGKVDGVKTSLQSLCESSLRTTRQASTASLLRGGSSAVDIGRKASPSDDDSEISTSHQTVSYSYNGN